MNTHRSVVRSRLTSIGIGLACFCVGLGASLLPKGHSQQADESRAWFEFGTSDKSLLVSPVKSMSATGTVSWIPGTTPVICAPPANSVANFNCRALDESIPAFNVVPENTKLLLYTLHAHVHDTGRFWFGLGQASISFRRDRLIDLANSNRIAGQVRIEEAIRLASASPLMALEAGEPLRGAISYQRYSEFGAQPFVPDSIAVWGELEELVPGILRPAAAPADRIEVRCGAPAGGPRTLFTCHALGSIVPPFSSVPDGFNLRVRRIQLTPTEGPIGPWPVLTHFFALGSARTDFVHSDLVSVSLANLTAGGAASGATPFSTAHRNSVELDSATPLMIVSSGQALSGWLGLVSLVGEGADAYQQQTALRSEEFEIWAELYPNGH